MEHVVSLIEDKPVRVLIVDDETSIHEVLTDFLVLEGYEVVSVLDGESAVAIIQEEFFDAILLDMKMPGISGLEVLRRLNELNSRAVTLMMTGYGTVETAIVAMKAGAYDYILKPFRVQEMMRLLARGVAERRLEEENIQLKEAVRLYELSQTLSSTLELQHIYSLLVDTTRVEIKADAVMVFARMGSVAADLEPVRHWARSDLDPFQLEALDGLDMDWLMGRSHDPEPMVFLGDQAQRIVGGFPAARVISILCVPMRSKNKTVGMLVAVSFEGAHVFIEGKRKMLSVLCGRASAAIENAGLYGELKHTFKQTIQALANLLEDKDPYTHGHSERVSAYARDIAVAQGLGAQEVEDIADCALMHDIGKLGIRYEDLNKVEPLSQAEYEMFKSHTTRGKWILEPIPFLHHLIPGVYHHHERWDGKGYPLGLSGLDIPHVARILAVADTYDAMTSHRAYRRALPHDVAVREIEAFAGTQFDPKVVEAFLKVMRERKVGYHSKTQRWDAFKEHGALVLEGGF